MYIVRDLRIVVRRACAISTAWRFLLATHAPLHMVQSIVEQTHIVVSGVRASRSFHVIIDCVVSAAHTVQTFSVPHGTIMVN